MALANAPVPDELVSCRLEQMLWMQHVFSMSFDIAAHLASLRGVELAEEQRPAALIFATALRMCQRGDQDEVVHAAALVGIRRYTHMGITVDQLVVPVESLGSTAQSLPLES